MLFLAQVLSKLLPFLFNSVFVYRTISSTDGVGDTLVMFPLVYAFVLSIRDGLRRSLLRRTFREEGESEDDDENERAFRVATRYVKRYVVFVLVLLMVPLLLLLLFFPSSSSSSANMKPNISRLLRLRRLDRVNERTALRLVTKEATLWIASDGGNCWDICKDRDSVLPPVVLTYRLFDNTK